MTKGGRTARDYLRVLLDVRAIIFGISILHLIVTLMWISRWYRKFGNGPVDVYPDGFLTLPIVLVFAAVLLLIRRWWSYLLAAVASAWVIYSLGYVALRAASIARDVPLLSSESLRVWFAEKYFGQPQEFLQLALAFTVVSYVLVALSQHWRGAQISHP